MRIRVIFREEKEPIALYRENTISDKTVLIRMPDGSYKYPMGYPSDKPAITAKNYKKDPQLFPIWSIEKLEELKSLDIHWKEYDRKQNM